MYFFSVPNAHGFLLRYLPQSLLEENMKKKNYTALTVCVGVMVCGTHYSLRADGCLLDANDQQHKAARDDVCR